MARRAVPAARPTQKYTPAFSVEKLDGEYEMTVAKMVPMGRPDKNGNMKHRLEYSVEKRPCGYLVHTPKTQGGYERNGSFHIATLDELETMGFADTEVPLVDLEKDDEPVGSIPNRIVRKEKVNA